MTQESKIRVPMAAIRSVLPFRAILDVRYYLNGIYVEPYDGGCIIVATDGYILAAFDSKGAYADEPRILDVNKEFGSMLAKKWSYSTVVNDENECLEVRGDPLRAFIIGGTEERYIRPGRPFIDGKYPDWRKVVPPKDVMQRGLPMSLNAKYLSVLKNASLKSRYGVPVQFYFDKRKPEESASIVRFSETPELLLVIMPIRDRGPAPWPAWMRETETPTPTPTEAVAA